LREYLMIQIGLTKVNFVPYLLYFKSRERNLKAI